MKKAFMLVPALLFLLAPLAAATVTVSSPNGGEQWPLHEKRNIKWETQNAGALLVDIILRDQGGVVGTIKSNVHLADRNWLWQDVGTLEKGTLPADFSGRQFIVRIRDAGNTFGDSSDSPFSITPASSEPSPEKPLKKAVPNLLDNLGKPLTRKIIEEYNFVPDIQNCHFILARKCDEGNPGIYTYPLWEGLPTGLVNVGFLWLEFNPSDPDYDKYRCKLSEVWNGKVSFIIHTDKLIGMGNVKEARLIIKRKWKTQIKLNERPGVTKPCLIGIVLLDDNPPCEWGNLYGDVRASVPPNPGKGIPLDNPDGDNWSVDVTEHLQQIVKGERKDHGFMLYTWEHDPIHGQDWGGGQYAAYNAGCYEVSLYVKFAHSNAPNP